MSLVGTRPPTVDEWEKYDLHHRVRLSVKPGITGMWQVSGRSEITDFEEVVKLDKEYISRGFQESGIVSLGIFDYLADGEMVSPDTKSSPSIAIAGNLAKGKCAYIYKIFGQSGTENKTLSVHLFGNNYSVDVLDSRFIYHGSFKPEDLPSHLKGDYGLVWDGDSAETCSGNTGEYLKYNNPHKTSLYLASGIPIKGNVQEAVELTGREFGITQEEQDGIFRYLVEGGDLSLYGLTNAVTRMSQDVDSYDRATALEWIGWQVMQRRELYV